ncbi:hypothetical protein ACQKFS_01135 [Pseudomonas guineae]|uniref:hypothetical protein n=1 Tax=Pseudomonas guineae TaxID=425504 RepID=UPI003D011606
MKTSSTSFVRNIRIAIATLAGNKLKSPDAIFFAVKLNSGAWIISIDSENTTSAKAINITEKEIPIISGNKLLIRFLILHSLEMPND